MSAAVLLDTGPLVAFLDRRDVHHEWARARMASLPAPLLTNEAVLAEACHLVRKLPSGRAAVLALVTTGAVRVGFRLADQAVPVEALLRKYDSVPMSLADACLVRMTELIAEAEVFTVDEDFTVYRRHGRRVVPTILPPRKRRR